jgi:hypothetical protein
MDDDDERPPPKKYTLVYGADGNLYAVAKNGAVPIEGGPPNSPVPTSVAQDVKNSLEGPNPVEIPNGVENYVESKLAPYMAPAGSGVRVRLPKILD